MTAPPGHLAAFSFDIEDWHHSELRHVAPADRTRESIVRRGTEEILDLLKRHGVRSTFFVLGCVVREHPDLVRRMVDEGHELAWRRRGDGDWWSSLGDDGPAGEGEPPQRHAPSGGRGDIQSGIRPLG